MRSPHVLIEDMVAMEENNVMNKLELFGLSWRSLSE